MTLCATKLISRISAFLGVITIASSLSAHEAPQIPDQIFAEAGKIVTTDGIDEQMMVEIGGIRQWVHVRGRHRANPVILFVHGVPAFTTSPVAYHFMRDWEEYFTVVQWDQRGSGKTYAANDPSEVRQTMNVARFVADATELAEHLRERYGKRKIILMGHSLGTVIGVTAVQARPELFHAYVGSGQFVHFARSEAQGYAATLAAARADGNKQAVEHLMAIAPFPDPHRPERNLENLGTERRWLAHYDGYYWRKGFGHNAAIASMSPVYTADELKLRDEAMGFSNEAMWRELGTVDLTGATKFEVPVIILQGRHDRGTSSKLVGEWFETIQAPEKHLVWFEDSAHMVHEEEPGKLLVSLVTLVRPLADASQAVAK